MVLDVQSEHRPCIKAMTVAVHCCCPLLQYLALLVQRGREQDGVRQVLLGQLLGLVQAAAKQARKAGRRQHGEQLLLELQGGWRGWGCAGACLACWSRGVVCLQLLYQEQCYQLHLDLEVSNHVVQQCCYPCRNCTCICSLLLQAVSRCWHNCWPPTLAARTSQLRQPPPGGTS